MHLLLIFPDDLRLVLEDGFRFCQESSLHRLCQVCTSPGLAKGPLAVSIMLAEL